MAGILCEYPFGNNTLTESFFGEFSRLQRRIDKMFDEAFDDPFFKHDFDEIESSFGFDETDDSDAGEDMDVEDSYSSDSESENDVIDLTKTNESEEKQSSTTQNVSTVATVQSSNTLAPFWNRNFGSCTVSEEDKQTVVKIDMTGVPKENIDVKFDKGTLTIKAEQRVEKKSKRRQFVQNGSFMRSFYVGDVDAEAIKAKMDNGNLEIYIPKPEKPTKSTITIA